MVKQHCGLDMLILSEDEYRIKYRCQSLGCKRDVYVTKDRTSLKDQTGVAGKLLFVNGSPHTVCGRCKHPVALRDDNQSRKGVRDGFVIELKSRTVTLGYWDQLEDLQVIDGVQTIVLSVTLKLWSVPACMDCFIMFEQGKAHNIEVSKRLIRNDQGVMVPAKLKTTFFNVKKGLDLQLADMPFDIRQLLNGETPLKKVEYTVVWDGTTPLTEDCPEELKSIGRMFGPYNDRKGERP